MIPCENGATGATGGGITKYRIVHKTVNGLCPIVPFSRHWHLLRVGTNIRTIGNARGLPKGPTRTFMNRGGSWDIKRQTIRVMHNVPQLSPCSLHREREIWMGRNRDIWISKIIKIIQHHLYNFQTWIEQFRLLRRVTKIIKIVFYNSHKNSR